MHELLEASDIAIARAEHPQPLKYLLKMCRLFLHCAALHEKGNIDFALPIKWAGLQK